MCDVNGELIRLKGISRVYTAETVKTEALNSIDLVIRRGEFVAVTGPSGCGKTTLLSIIGLLDKPSAGRYLLEGMATEDLSEGSRARIRNQQIGFVFQAFNLIDDLTVYQNVELPLTYRGTGARERRRRVCSALERVGMSHRLNHLPSQLSGGQQQRVAVARAVAGDPLIVLADEPTGNLDSANGEAVMGLLRDLHREGSTVCMVTHDPRYSHHAQRGIELHDGLLAGAG